jgi:hydroxymethylglutaryl-CoA reductase (NADPH)
MLRLLSKNDMKDIYPIVPGRGLVTDTAKTLRLGYLELKDLGLREIPKGLLKTEDIRNNIESHIGSIEIPIGLVGPLLFNNNNNKEEYVHTLLGTLEGALVASMNRGAKCVSLSGGFSASVIHQKMIRTPMFIFESLREGVQFIAWVKDRFKEIKKIAESYSNHAKLESINPFLIGKSVHLKFVYTTGDASGQNMTTSCTWQSVLWIQDQFEKDTEVNIIHSIIEGNGASDKKVSNFSINHGRGIHVVAEVHLKEEVIEKVLRTSSKEFVRCFGQSVAMSQIDGMVGYNINVANAIAGIFAATGQDLGCIHESSCGVLNIEQTEDGLYLSLNLPSLVIGTVGGGTHLSKQREALSIMGCAGNGKVNRFAQLIAGFALSLEISTYAAIVSGQFAKSHEKLGRNKPKNWLLKSEIDRDFIQNILKDEVVKDINLTEVPDVDNGILTTLASKVSKKLIGFTSVLIETDEKKIKALIKSKPLDDEVYRGLHFMASNIDVELADLIDKYADQLEYKKCHLKELELYRLIDELGLDISPRFYGAFRNTKREIYLIVNELLDQEKLTLFNSENSPELWNQEHINNVIKSISSFHQKIRGKLSGNSSVKEFNPFDCKDLYVKLIDLIINDAESEEEKKSAKLLTQYLSDLKEQPDLEKTIVHNDFNPRNVAIRETGDVCIYDWELAIVGLPHRDIVEFLSFTLSENFTNEELDAYLKFHFQLANHNNTLWEKWKEGYEYALKEYLVTRVSFYVVGSILINYEFASRILRVSLKMLSVLKSL